MSELSSRSEAVAYLRERGLHAVERDWVLGQTVFVGSNPTNVTDTDILSLKGIRYLVPQGEKWVVVDLDLGPEPESRTLQDACDHVIRILRPDLLPTRL